MPVIKVANQATSTDALANLNFNVQSDPALVTLFASAVTATDKITFSVGSTTFCENANPNIEASADVVDTDRDAVLIRELVPPGQYRLAVTATTAVNFLLVIDPIPAR